MLAPQRRFALQHHQSLLPALPHDPLAAAAQTESAQAGTQLLEQLPEQLPPY